MTPPERLQDVIAEMREWAHGEGCFNDDPEGEPLLCVYYSQQAFLSLCDRIEAAAALSVRGEPVAWVRWSPKHGYAFRTVHTERDPVVNGDWRSVPLYATPPSEG